MIERLTSFGVRGFRALSRLDIDDLGEVNLFVGKNNTGKTTVLEALRIFFSTDPRVRIYQLLTNREEFSFARRMRTNGFSANDAGPSLSFDALFFGRPNLESHPEFCVGRLPQPEKDGLSIKFVWLQREILEEDASVRYHVVENIESNPDATPGLQIRSSNRTLLGPLDRINRLTMQRRLTTDFDQEVVYVSSSGLTMREIGETWDSIALTDEEDDVVKALKIIAPTLEKIVLVQSPQRSESNRILMAKLSTFSYPVPFKSLGEGTVHLLSLVLGMIQARNGTLLLDEVENGVHFSVQESMWKLIMDQALKLNVQVFATTHSSDCVNGFQAAASTCPGITGRLFRLEEERNRIRAVDFTTEEVSIATDEGIEIR